MKFSATVTSLLLATSGAVAAPNAPRATQNFALRNLSAKILSKSDFGNLAFLLTDPNTGVSTNCEVWWNPPQHFKGPFKCENEDYQFNLPEELLDIKTFSLEVEDAAKTHEGQVKLSTDIPGQFWECKDNPTEFIETQCNWTADVLTVSTHGSA